MRIAGAELKERHMRNLFIVAAAALTLGACAVNQQSLAEGERYNWRCDDAKAFSLRYAAGQAEVYASGQTHTLAPVADHVGQYSNGNVSFTQDDGRASLTGVFNGPFENCRRASGPGDGSWWRFW
jgi:hypothetical protein